MADLVRVNLEDQHDWTAIQTREPPLGDSLIPPVERPVLSGMPPRRLYVHPDEQIEALQAQDSLHHKVSQEPEVEWVVPVHISEKLSLRHFASIFDSIDALPPGVNVSDASVSGTATAGRDWRGSARHKRFLLAVVHDDSTVSYYIMHDGIVKPRQN